MRARRSPCTSIFLHDWSGSLDADVCSAIDAAGGFAGPGPHQALPMVHGRIALFALRLLVEVLLSGRLAPTVLRVIFIALADLMALVGLLVVAEVARRAFGGVQRRTWVLWTVALVAVASGVLAVWGPWPAWRDLTRDAPLAVLRVMQLLAQKADLLMDVLTVQLGVLVVLFGGITRRVAQSHAEHLHRTFHGGRVLAAGAGNVADHRHVGSSAFGGGIRAHHRPGSQAGERQQSCLCGGAGVVDCLLVVRRAWDDSGWGCHGGASRSVCGGRAAAISAVAVGRVRDIRCLSALRF